MLLCLLSRCRRRLQESEEGAGEVAFEAADGFAFAFASVGAAGDVGLGGGLLGFGTAVEVLGPRDSATDSQQPRES